MYGVDARAVRPYRECVGMAFCFYRIWCRCELNSFSGQNPWHRDDYWQKRPCYRDVFSEIYPCDKDLWRETVIFIQILDKYFYSSILRQLADKSLDFKRYLYDEIPDDSFVGIMGPRGVGKSILLLQKIKESDKKSLYVDADNLYFATHSFVSHS